MKTNSKKTPPRRSPRKLSVRLKTLKSRLKPYESPLKHLQKKGKQAMLDELSPLVQVKKRQKRESIIILNDENDDSESPRIIRHRTAKARNPMSNNRLQPKNKLLSRTNATCKINEPSTTNDSVIILEDDENLPSSENSNQNEDLVVVWSSVSGTTKQTGRKNCVNSSDPIPFVIDRTPNVSNFKMLGGDYPREWLGNWLSEERSKDSEKTSVVKVKKNKKTKAKNRKETAEHAEKQEKGRRKEIVRGNLREIIIDGPNVAMAYSKGKYFSEKGLKLVIDFFKDKGHIVKAFVPQHVRNRKRQVLEDLNNEGYIVFTPSRKAGTKYITPYDDRYILEYATKCNGIVVSNDQFKDLYEEKPEWRQTIEKRILPATFVGDMLMFPEDPLGRHGPNLKAFLRHES